MTALRWAAGIAGAILVAGVALAELWGLVGAIWAWPDVLNNFALVWVVAAWIGGAAARLLLPPSRGRAWTVMAAAFVVLAAGAPIAAEAVKAETDHSAGPPTLTVLTFNRWWDSTEPAREAATIRSSGADLVALQEADNFARAAASLKDVYPYQRPCSPACDTLILSKRPILASGREDHARWSGTDLLWARTTAPDGRPVTLATIHMFWPIPPWIQAEQRRRIAAELAAMPHDDLVLVGDFNLAPWTFTMGETDRALAPLTRRTHGLLTFPTSWPFPFLALDQVFAGPAWRTVRIRALPRAGSDHYPVLVQLRR